jgi:hypothetical protein
MSEKIDMNPPEEAKEKILQVLNEAVENKASYTYEELLVMFDGGSHMEPEQIKYIYHFLRGDIEESKHYLKICLEKANELKANMSKMVDAKDTNFYEY